MLYQRFTNEMNEINNIKFVCNKLSHKHDVLILLYKAQYFNNRWSIHNIPITRTILMNILIIVHSLLYLPITILSFNN